jgi:hypothetical protein
MLNQAGTFESVLLSVMLHSLRRRCRYGGSSSKHTSPLCPPWRVAAGCSVRCCSEVTGDSSGSGRGGPCFLTSSSGLRTVQHVDTIASPWGPQGEKSDRHNSHVTNCLLAAAAADPVRYAITCGLTVAVRVGLNQHSQAQGQRQHHRAPNPAICF